MTKRAVAVPMIGSDGWVRVALTALGTTARAVVDTGAFAELCIPHSLARRRKLVTGREPKVYPDGDAKDCMLKRPLPFRLGRHAFVAKEVLAWERDGLREPDDPITHILGLRFMLKHKTELDFKRRRVVFHPLSSQPQRSFKRPQVIPFQQIHNHALLLAVEVARTPGWMLWDTGAPAVFLFPPALKRLGLRLLWSKREVANVHGLTRQSEAVRAPLAVSALGGELPLKPSAMYGLDAPHERAAMELSVGRPLLGLMNVDVCGASRVLIDPQRCFLWREP